MKTINLLLLISALVFSCACGASVSGFSGDDLRLNIGGKFYTLEMDIEDIIAEFGTGFEYAEAQSCDYDGLDKTFIYDTAQFFTYPSGENDLVSEVYSDSPDARTSRGLGVGASRDDVLAAYGSDCRDTSYQIIYTAEEGALYFDMDGDEVAALYITSRGA
ncbi:MAG: hypothetical protein FWH02_06710 [Oscillospiraceae bacterium]|nr:hypothetical protein [Oscillospiraceae bacterium]